MMKSFKMLKVFLICFYFHHQRLITEIKCSIYIQIIVFICCLTLINSQEEGGEAHPAPEPYAFSFSVDDTESGALTSREERQDASGEVVGK